MIYSSLLFFIILNLNPKSLKKGLIDLLAIFLNSHGKFFNLYLSKIYSSTALFLARFFAFSINSKIISKFTSGKWSKLWHFIF